MLPLVAKMTASVSHWLAGFSGELVELKPDLDQVPALAVERDQQWARVGGASFLTDDEKRSLLGLTGYFSMASCLIARPSLAGGR